MVVLHHIKSPSKLFHSAITFFLNKKTVFPYIIGNFISCSLYVSRLLNFRACALAPEAAQKSLT